MLGNFKYHNPTKLYFGNQSLQFLNQELPEYGHNVVLIYGGGSIKKNGIYQAVMDILTKNNKNVVEISGVMPNPTLKKLYEGIDIARQHQADLLLAVGGVRSATMPRRSPFLSIATKTRGTNTSSAMKNRIARASP